ncbi:MAG: DEAD/DEAH box helicase [Nanoarchaeota archaeon]
MASKEIPSVISTLLDKFGITELRPSQEKAIEAGLFEDDNVLVCTPTASGKTLVGEMAMYYAVLSKGRKGVYVVPLRALASEKYREFKKRYPRLKIALASGDIDSKDEYLSDFDVVITTSEKLDSLIRHHVSWLSRIGVLVIDEIHLLNDVSRGPTLEVLITILKRQLPELQIIGLSATIGNAKELASWLDADLVEDRWRPVRLDKGILHGETVYFPEKE